MPRLMLEVAQELADAHRKYDPATQTVKLFNGTSDEIRLLEVSGAAHSNGEILPYRFNPDPASGIDYPSVVVLVSPADWEQVQAHRIALPSGWDLTEAHDL